MLFDCCTPKRDKTLQTEAEETNINAEDVEQNSLAREVLSEVIKKIEALKPKANYIIFPPSQYARYRDQWKICSDNIASIQNKLFEKHTPSTISAETETIYKGLGEAITTYNNSISAGSTNVKPKLIKTLHINNGAVDIDALKKACQDEKNSPYSCC